MNECQTMSIVEAGRVLGVGKPAAYKAAHAGEIPTIRVGRRMLVPKIALERMLAGAGVRNEKTKV